MEKYGISFKEMNKKQKVKHIWTYYRYHILATVIGIFVAFSLGKTIFFPQADDKVDVVICGPMYLDENQYEFVDAFRKEYKTGLDLTSVSWEEDSQLSMALLEKIPLLITTKTLDILALPEDQYTDFARKFGEDAFIALEKVPELKDVLEAHEDQLFIYDKGIDEEGNETQAEKHVYGIKVEGFPTISCIKESTPMVIGVVSTMRDKQKTLDMYEYLLGDETALDHFFDGDENTETK